MKIRLLAVAILFTALGGVGSLVGVSATSPASGFTLGGQPCEPVSMDVAAPVGLGTSTQCAGVRPGATALTEQGLCTFNFMWRGADGRTYMGTAGHCALGVIGSGEAAWGPGEGPPVADGQGNLIGEFAYAVVDDPHDFALVRLGAGVAASPEMCHFGGPTGISTDEGALALLQHYGQGSVVGQVVPGRSMLAVSMSDPDFLVAAGIVTPGDSGSPVTTTDGRAVGVVVTTGLYVGVLDAGTVGITRIGPQIARAEQATGVDYTLQTAPAR